MVLNKRKKSAQVFAKVLVVSGLSPESSLLVNRDQSTILRMPNKRRRPPGSVFVLIQWIKL